MKVFVLGPAGTNGHEAAQRMMGTQKYGPSEFEFCERNGEIFEQVIQHQGFGFVPIENATTGLVGDAIKYWLNVSQEPRAWVIGEIELPIKHHLLVRKSVTHPSDVTAVLSHPQAIGQCVGSLNKLGIKVRTPTNSTAGAAQMVTDDDSLQNAGALASEFAAMVYGLRILISDMQDSPTNATRFHMIASGPCVPTGNDRTALIFWVPNRHMALANALTLIGMDGVNLSCTHSIPLGAPGEYAFYVEFDCHKDDSLGRKIIRRLETIVTSMTILGSFPRNIPEKKGV